MFTVHSKWCWWFRKFNIIVSWMQECHAVLWKCTKLQCLLNKSSEIVIFNVLFLQDACKISQVLFMKRLLDSLVYQDINSADYIYWASCLAGAQFLMISIGNHAFFCAEVLGVNCRSSCLSLVYQKVFR